MMIRRSGMTAVGALCAAALVAGCADETTAPSPTDDAIVTAPEGPGGETTSDEVVTGGSSLTVLGEFTGYGNPMTGEFRIESVAPTASPQRNGLRTVPQALWCNMRGEADGTAGVGSRNSVEIVTEPGTVGQDATCFGGTWPEPEFVYIAEGAFCGDVTVRSFYADVLDEVYAEITELVPFTNHGPHPDSLNSARPEGPDAPLNQFGLWYYGDLDASGTPCTGTRCTDPAVGSGDDESTVQWLFSRGDALDFTFSGRVVARIEETCGNGVDDDCDGVVDNGCGSFLDNAECYDDSDCASLSCTDGLCDISCPVGYWGADCTNECTGGAVNPCSDNGTCIGGVAGDGTCDCDEGWGGAACDVCGDGWYGANCENACPVGADNACYGNGTCSDGFGGDGTCVCTNPLSHGDDCENTCDDGVRNGTEVGVDCGGPCAASCWNREVQFTAFDVDLRKRFGWRIAGDGDWLAAGAVGELSGGEDNAGAGYIFRWNGTQYVQNARIEPPVIEQNALFGYAVAIAGDLAVFAAPFETDREATDSGAVYVYRRNVSNVWNLEARITPPIEERDLEFGFDVDTDGTRIVVGAHGYNGPTTWPTGNGNNNGAVFVYERVVDTWTLSQTLTIDHAGNNARLGRVLDLDGDLLVSSAWSWAYREPDDSQVRTGMAYAWRFNGGSGLFELEQVLDPGNLLVGDRYGFGVAVDADSEVIAIAASARDTVLRDNGGSMFVWRNDGGWTFDELVEPQGRSITGWGIETAIDDDTIWVARGGRIYEMTWDGTQWVFEQEFTRPSGVAANSFAGTVDVLDGTRLLVGASFDSEFSERGTVFVYEFDVAGDPQFAQSVVPVDVQVGDAFGWVISLSSDYVVAGASGEDPNALNQAGAAYVFSRTGLVWNGQAKLLPSDQGGGDQFGSAISVSGDVVAVSSPRWDTTFGGDNIGDAGAVYIFRFDGTDWNEVARIESPYISDRDHYKRFGTAIALDGDWLAVHTQYDEQPITPTDPLIDPPACRNNGAVDMFRYNPAGVPGAGDTEAWERVTLPPASPDCGAEYGTALDMDGTRLAVGSYAWAPSSQGSVFVYDFSGGVWNFTARLFNDVDAQNGEQLGRAVSVRGDTIIAGAPFFDRRAGGATGTLEAVSTGRASVFRFSGGLWSLEQSFYPPALEPDARFGESVAIEGEVAVIGAIGVDGFELVGGVVQPLTDAGTVYVYSHTTGTWEIDVSLAASDGDDFDQFGRSVDIVDNRIAVGAVFEDIAGTEDTGAAYLYE